MFNNISFEKKINQTPKQLLNALILQIDFMRYLLIILFFSIAFLSQAQLFDSIQKSFIYKPKPLFKLETRNSFITSEVVKVRAVKVGLNFNRKTQIGLSYNWLKRKTLIYTQDSSTLKMNYVSLFFEYVFYRDKHFTLAIPVLMGLGNSKYVSKEGTDYAKSFIMTYEPGMTFEYRFLRYFGIGTGVGFRVMLIDNPKIKEQLNSPVYIFRFKIYFGDIVNDIF